MSYLLDRFGEFITANFRDPAIDHTDKLLAGKVKGAALKKLQADLKTLTDAQREMVRRCVIARE